MTRTSHRWQHRPGSFDALHAMEQFPADNGLGMDYEISKKVFSKFFTTKGSDRGTGLGLLTTKRMVHQHGGHISFTSTEGEGSVFRIELPRDTLPVPESAEVPTDGGDPPLSEREVEP